MLEIQSAIEGLDGIDPSEKIGVRKLMRTIATDLSTLGFVPKLLEKFQEKPGWKYKHFIEFIKLKVETAYEVAWIFSTHS